MRRFLISFVWLFASFHFIGSDPVYADDSLGSPKIQFGKPNPIIRLLQVPAKKISLSIPRLSPLTAAFLIHALPVALLNFPVSYFTNAAPETVLTVIGLHFVVTGILLMEPLEAEREKKNGEFKYKLMSPEEYRAEVRLASGALIGWGACTAVLFQLFGKMFGG